MTTMIERVARAIKNKVEKGYTTYEEAARTAIEAMREPTEAMIEAAKSDEGVRILDGAVHMASIHGFNLKYIDGKPPIIRAFNAMIDAALNEKEQG